MADWANDIQRANDLYRQLYKSRDFTALSHLYTEDCSLMPSGFKLGTGRQAVVAVMSALPGTGVDDLVFSSREVIPEKERAIERGSYVFYKSDGTFFDIGKYVVIWRRVDGSPKLYIDTWNSDAFPI